MRILEHQQDFTDEVNYLINENPSFVYISTFGMYLGISINDKGEPVDWHTKYPKALRAAVDNIVQKKIPCKIITGETVKDLCVENCPHCIKINENFLKRLQAHVDKFQDHIDFRIKTEYHMKLILSDKRYIIGGRNFSESSFDDLSFTGTEKKMLKDLKEIFERKFDQ